MKKKIISFAIMSCVLNISLYGMVKDSSKEDLVSCHSIKTTHKALNAVQWLAREAHKHELTVWFEKGKESKIFSALPDSVEQSIGNLIIMAALDHTVDESTNDINSKIKKGVFVLDSKRVDRSYHMASVCKYEPSLRKIAKDRFYSDSRLTTHLDALIIYNAAYKAIRENNVKAVLALALHNKSETEWLYKPVEAYPFFKKSALEIARELYGEGSSLFCVLKSFKELYEETSEAYNLFCAELMKLSTEKKS